MDKNIYIKMELQFYYNIKLCYTSILISRIYEFLTFIAVNSGLNYYCSFMLQFERDLCIFLQQEK